MKGVWVNRRPVAALTYELEVLPLLSEQETTLELFGAVRTETFDDKRQKVNGAARPLRLEPGEVQCPPVLGSQPLKPTRDPHPV